MFAVEVDRRLDRSLAEADALQATDPALAAQIRGREAELAAALNELDEEVQAERARARAAELAAQADSHPLPDGIKPVAGGVVDVACPAGGSVQVAGDISGSVERLLTDAAEAGISMCGYGYRDPADQIAVRRANCGTSSYAIYQAPSSYCSPPTARPGTSMHEQGLAIDFTSGGGGTIGYGSAAYRVVEGQRRQLRPLQPAGRALALVGRRQLTRRSARRSIGVKARASYVGNAGSRHTNCGLATASSRDFSTISGPVVTLPRVFVTFPGTFAVPRDSVPPGRDHVRGATLR